MTKRSQSSEAERTRYLLADCREPTDIGPTLLLVLDEVRTFGCATVYVMRST